MVNNQTGSFYIDENNSSLGTTYTVKYQKQHSRTDEWPFLKKEQAILFAQKKTRIDNKLNKRK